MDISRRRFFGSLGAASLIPFAESQGFQNRGFKGKRLRVGRGRYRTIESIQPILEPGVNIEVMPGIYNEQFRLVDGTNWFFKDGAIIDFDSAAPNMPTITDDGNAVNCSITGSGVFRRKGAANGSNVIKISGDSNVSIFCKEVFSEVTSFSDAVSLVRGNFDFAGNITAIHAIALRTLFSLQNNSVNIIGNIHSDEDYGVLSGGGNVNIQGMLSSNWNSGLHCSAGNLNFMGTSTSQELFGFEMSGGSASLRNSRLVSFATLELDGDAISKYGGEDLSLDNCAMMSTRADAFSIGTQESLQTVFIVDDCHANRIVDPNVTLYGGTVIVDL